MFKEIYYKKVNKGSTTNIVNVPDFDKIQMLNQLVEIILKANSTETFKGLVEDAIILSKHLHNQEV